MSEGRGGRAPRLPGLSFRRALPLPRLARLFERLGVADGLAPRTLVGHDALLRLPPRLRDEASGMPVNGRRHPWRQHQPCVAVAHSALEERRDVAADPGEIDYPGRHVAVVVVEVEVGRRLHRLGVIR